MYNVHTWAANRISVMSSYQLSLKVRRTFFVQTPKVAEICRRIDSIQKMYLRIKARFSEEIYWIAIMNEVMEIHTHTQKYRSERKKKKNSIEHTCMWLADTQHNIEYCRKLTRITAVFRFISCEHSIYSSQIIKIILYSQYIHSVCVCMNWKYDIVDSRLHIHTHLSRSFVCLFVWIEIIEIRSQHSKWSLNGNIFGTKKSI